MNRKTKIIISLLAIFVIGMTLGIAFAEPVNAKTFKSSSGYKWEIKDSTWEKMKDKAYDEYNKMNEIGSSYPGYSDALNVTVTRGGHSYQGIAMAIKNNYGIRCEVRGADPYGEYITANETQMF